MNTNTSTPVLQIPTPINTFDVANTLAAKGFRVFPLRRWSKLPFEGSFKNSTGDLAIIANSFESGQNVGMATGHEHGGDVVVLDFDVPIKGQAMELRDMEAAVMLVMVLSGVMGQEAAVSLFNDAPRVRTPSGGWQVYLRQEAGAALTSRPGIAVNGLCDQGKGLPTSDGTSFDTRGEGGYAVAVGSVTKLIIEELEGAGQKMKQSAGTYQLYVSGQPANLCDLPNAHELPVLPAAAVAAIEALPLIKQDQDSKGEKAAQVAASQPDSAQAAGSKMDNPPSHVTQNASEGVSMGFGHRAPKDPQRVRDVLSHSITHVPERYGGRQGWLDVMTALAGATAAGELSEEEGDAIYEWFCANTPGNKSHNEGQWHATKELARQRLRNGEHVRGCKSIIEQGVADGWVDPMPPAEVDAPELWPGRAKATKSGLVPYDNALNAAAILTREGYEFRLITRGHFHEVRAPSSHVSPALPAGWQTLGDSAVRQLTGVVNAGGLPTAKPSTVAQAAKALGDKGPWDPFKEALEKLDAWDGVARIEDIPSRYLGAEAVPVTAAYFEHFLMLVIARTFCPGCKADEMLVLIGNQRTGKSSALRKLVGDEFFTDAVTLRDGAKEIIEKTQRTALIEVSEMIGVSGAGAEKYKATISRQEDRARLAYGAETTQVKRAFVWAGTSNDPELFNDPSGSLRFMPITVGTIDTAAIERDREQILAEALHKFRTGFGGDARRVNLDPKWWDAAKAETEKYEITNPWEDAVSAILVDERHKLRVWTDERGRHGFILSSGELLGRLLPQGYNKTGAQAKRLSEVMHKLGFSKSRTMIDRKRATRYFRPFTQEELAWRAAQVQAGQPVDDGQGIGLLPGLVAVS